MSADEIDALKRMLDQLAIPLNAHYADESLAGKTVTIDALFAVRLLKYAKKAADTLEGNA